MGALTKRRPRSAVPHSALAQAGGESAVSTYIKFKHWKLLLAVWVAAVTWRFVAGAVMIRSRATDATYVHAARVVRGGWWAERAGWVRQAARLGPLAAWIAWHTWSAVGTALVSAAVLGLAAWWGLRRWRESQRERVWLAPMWPAIAQVLGDVASTAPPRSWVQLHSDPRDADATITVGLPPRTGDDRPVVAALTTILDQRLGAGRWTPEVDHAGRVVVFSHRPEDPEVWEAMAAVLRLDRDALAGDWLTLPEGDLADQDARVVVTLPVGLPDDRRVVEELAALAQARFPGEWTYRTSLTDRTVVLAHKAPPAPTPPHMAPAADVAAFADRFGGVLPDTHDLEGLLTGLVDAPAPAVAVDPEFETVGDPADDGACEVTAEVVEDDDEPVRGAA